jgi:hypothetical protein
MTALHVIQFIRQHSLEDLRTQFAVKAARHRTYPTLVLLKYNQIESPMADPVVQECRGLILDEADAWKVVAFPYKKFFNYGEPNAAAIDWGTSRVYEKLDGSLMTLYWYREQWHVSSSGLPDAAGNAHDSQMTMADLFWNTWNQLGYSLPTDTTRCYMFELLTPHNRIIVQHTDPRLVLHGCRRLSDFVELPPDVANHGWEVVKTYPLTSIEDCLKAAEVIDPLRGEGYVVCDAAFNRVKIKAPQYVALAHLKDAITPRRLLELIRANESAEFLTYFPEFQEAYDAVKSKFDQLCDEVEADYHRLMDIADQKEFATAANKSRWSSALFAMRKGGLGSARPFAGTCTIQALERAIGPLALAIPASES